MLPPPRDGLGDTADEKTASLIVKKAVVEPLRWIAENGGEPGYVIVSKVRSCRPGTATTVPPVSTRTSSRPASSTR
jgi:chaperonin GroEL (HSP60 family)